MTCTNNCKHPVMQYNYFPPQKEQTIVSTTSKHASSAPRRMLQVYNGSCSPYDSSSYVVVAALSAGIAAISLVLLIAVVLILVLFKKHKFFSQRLILYLALSSILVNISIILHRVDYDNQTSEFYTRFCQFGGYLDQVSNWMLLMSVCSIVVYVSLRILFKRNTEKFELAYVFSIFVFPLTFTWIPFVFNAYGRSGAWCWITSENRITCEPFFTGQVLQYVLWFVPLYFFLLVLLVVYAILLMHQCQKRRRIRRHKNVQAVLVRDSLVLIGEQDFKTLTVFPILYFLLNIFPLINRTYNNLTTSAGPSLVLWYLAALANPIMGSLVTLAYFMDPETRKRLNFKHIRGATVEIFNMNDLIATYDVEIPKDNTLPRSDSYVSRNNH